jgi:hypothetical protein
MSPRVNDSDQVEVRDSGDDLIHPVQIRHEIEEIYNGGELEQIYNYIVYEFERSGTYVRARAYLDDIRTVSVFGPCRGENSGERIAAAELVDAVLAYLKRRYVRIDMFYEDVGYETIWLQSSG